MTWIPLTCVFKGLLVVPLSLSYLLLYSVAMAKSKGMIPSEKAAAMHTANSQQAPPPPPIWMLEKNTNCKCASSNNAELEPTKKPQKVMSVAKAMTELFDLDNNVAAPSGSDDNLDISEDNLKSLKMDKKRLKEVLDLERSHISKGMASNSDDDLDEPHCSTSDTAVSDGGDKQPIVKPYYHTPALKASKNVITNRKLKNTLTKEVGISEEDWPPSSQIVYSSSGCQVMTNEGSKPEGCISNFHNNVQKFAQAHVASHYDLMKGADTKVTDLLKKNIFIYPVNSKPYKAPTILDTIVEAFFGDKTSMTVQMKGSFQWLWSHLQVHSVIMQYLSKKYDHDFNCELYIGIYKTLSSSKANMVCSLEADKALMCLDIDAMPESEEEQ
ncbi:hypothetical protein BDR04DRAFT_1115459 [Suillus decipiens]|nr:hypothetical protein BDR04DRAFT_1115459 [Suillus decipiens]